MISLFRKIYFWWRRKAVEDTKKMAEHIFRSVENEEFADGIAYGITEFVYETHRKMGAMHDKDFPRWIMHLADYYDAAMRQIILDHFIQFRPAEPNTVEVQLLVNKFHNEEPIYMIFVATYACRDKETDIFPKLCVTILGTDQFNLYKAGLSEAPPWPEACTTIYKEVDLRYDFGQVMS